MSQGKVEDAVTVAAYCHLRICCLTTDDIRIYRNPAYEAQKIGYEIRAINIQGKALILNLLKEIKTNK
jgi:hypothetical protein